VGHGSTVFRALYGPDDTQLATVSADMTVRLWDLPTGKTLFTLRLPTEFRSPGPRWDFDFRCLPAAAPAAPTGPDAGYCRIAVSPTIGRLALYRLPYEAPPASIHLVIGGARYARSFFTQKGRAASAHIKSPIENHQQPDRSHAPALFSS